MEKTKSNVICLPVKPVITDYDVQCEEREEFEEEKVHRKTSGVFPDILLSLYAIGWGIWMFPYSLLIGSALLVSAGALGAKAFHNCGR